ncbi:MAG: hypothetical protein GY696_33070 [Gammaproteobacteria bacterium]|nr:hypothetical protein [Gammaproteobacteria bacterium]
MTKASDLSRRPKPIPRGEVMRNLTNQPPLEGVVACKVGGEEGQETIGPIQGRTEEEESAQGRGGAQPFQTDPELQLSEKLQRAQSLEITRRQWRPKYRMALNFIMASGAVLWLMLGGVSDTALISSTASPPPGSSGLPDPRLATHSWLRRRPQLEPLLKC